MVIAGETKTGPPELNSAARIIFDKNLREELDSMVLVVRHVRSQLKGALSMLSPSKLLYFSPPPYI